jgi:hypothetical protein
LVDNGHTVKGDENLRSSAQTSLSSERDTDLHRCTQISPLTGEGSLPGLSSQP